MLFLLALNERYCCLVMVLMASRAAMGSARFDNWPPWQLSRRSVRQNPADIDARQPAILLPDDAVYDHRIDILRLAVLDDLHRCIRFRCGQHIDAVRAQQDDIGTLPGRKRTGLIGDPEHVCAAEGAQLDGLRI
jgi:hypothetical protein